MERNAGLTFLVSIFAIATLSAIILIFYYARSGGQVRRIQAQITQIQSHRAFVQALGSDVFEYSKTHPTITPILQTVGTVPQTTNPSK